MNKRVLHRVLAFLLMCVCLFCSVNVGAYAYNLPEGYKMSSGYKSSVYYTRLAAVKLTGNQRVDIAAIAESQIGYHEGDKNDYTGSSTSSTANYAEYNRYAYYLNNAAWCGSFVSWCAAMAGISTDILPKTAAAKPVYWKMCGSTALKGASVQTPEDLVTNGGEYIPQVGDLAFFGSKSTGNGAKNECSHVGLITQVNLTYTGKEISRIEVITTEGNYSQKVKQNKYVFDANNRNGHAYGSTYLNTFGVPNYTSDNQTQQSKEYASIDIGAYGGSYLRLSSSGNAVKTLQMALNLVSVMDSSTIPTVAVDGEFDNETLVSVKKYQSASGLSADGIVGKDTWSALRSDLIRLTKKYANDCVVVDGKMYAYKGESDTVVLTDGISVIGAQAFHFRKSVTSVTLPKSVQKIESGAFAACSSLDKITYTGTSAQYQSIQIGANNAALACEKVSYKLATVTFKAGDCLQSVIVSVGKTPSIPSDLILEKAGDAYIYYQLSGWWMDGKLYNELPAIKGDCVLEAQFTKCDRLINVETLNNLLIALSEEAEDITLFDFCADGVLNVEDLNCLLILLASA